MVTEQQQLRGMSEPRLHDNTHRCPIHRTLCCSRVGTLCCHGTTLFPTPPSHCFQCPHNTLGTDCRGVLSTRELAYLYLCRHHQLSRPRHGWRHFRSDGPIRAHSRSEERAPGLPPARLRHMRGGVGRSRSLISSMSGRLFLSHWAFGNKAISY